MDVSSEDLSRFFQWPDYLVLALMILISALIGVYYACTGNKQSSTKEFLMAGRNMGTFPVAMSLLASFLSAIALLGIPAEIYFFGSQIAVGLFSFLVVMPASSYLYMPIFYRLQITSAYEYLELRFNRVVRCLCSAIFTIQTLLYMAVVIYAPALAISQVTGIDVYVAVTTTILVCIFYTALGGMKAVVWTDTLQVVIMYGSIVGVVAKGLYDVGGPAAVWQANQQSGRIEFFNFDVNPTTRHTFWNILIGACVTWLAGYGVSQTQVQRYLTIPTIQQVRKTNLSNWWTARFYTRFLNILSTDSTDLRRAIWMNLVGILVLFLICYCAGFILFAKYQHCDPFTANLISKTDQIFPFFVMETMGRFPGIPGLFVAGVYSGSLSTVSSGLTSLAAIALEDFIRPYFLPRMSDQTATRISKLVAVLYGFACFGFVILASKIHSVIEAVGTLTGIISGPLLAVFTLGMLFPWANTAGVTSGLVFGSSLMMWIGFGTIAAKNSGQIKTVRKPLSVEGCLFNLTTTLSTTMQPTIQPENPPLGIYTLSYAWYPVYGYVIVMLLGLIVSLVYKPQDPKKLDPRLICNLGDTIFRFLPAKSREFLRFNVGDEYVPTVEEKCQGEVNPAFIPENGHKFEEVDETQKKSEYATSKF